MADVDESNELKPRKSVQFSEDAIVVDANGAVTQKDGANEKTTAESHSKPPDDQTADGAVDEVAEMFKGLNKKKKSKKSKDTEEGADGAGADGEFDPTTIKKKKKKSKKVVDEDDFEAKLAEAGVSEGDADAPAGNANDAQEGDLEKGTGIWQHNATTPINYNLLLQRFFAILQNQNPDILSSGTKSYKIPPPQCLREGNKKTIFANIPDICKRMKRSEEHVIQFLFAELGTTGSVDGSKRLVIKGRFQQKQIEMVLRRYIVEYVTCKTCKSANTELSKGENRLYFVTCNQCGSRRSVTAIKVGFTAQIGKRKRQQG